MHFEPYSIFAFWILQVPVDKEKLKKERDLLLFLTPSEWEGVVRVDNAGEQGESSASGIEGPAVEAASKAASKASSEAPPAESKAPPVAQAKSISKADEKAAKKRCLGFDAFNVSMSRPPPGLDF